MKKNTLYSCTKSILPKRNNQLTAFLKVFNHYFGSFKRFFKVTDPRKSEKCLYPLESYLYLALMMFILRMKAVRQISFLLKTADANTNFDQLFRCPHLPHSTSINKISRRLNPDEMQNATTYMVKYLIKQRVLEQYRFLGRYMIAIDGTYTYSSSKRHCKHCLTRTSKKTKKTTYYHMILEAKLVTSDGFAFSIMSEFVQNEEENPSKQDCETKAFHRLAEKLKEAFPRQGFILLLDGLFADGSIFQLCKEKNWEAIIVLKDKDLSTVNQEFENLKLMHPEQAFIVRKHDGCKQSFSWCNEIDYVDGKKRQFHLNILECIEQQADAEETKYKVISTIKVHRNNICKLSDAGRTRWVIENQGFNTQKNHGFALKHQYSKDYTGMKVFYYLLQIAHTWEQLTRRSNLFKRLCKQKYGSIKNIYYHMLEEWRNKVLDEVAMDFIKNAKVQIRLDTG